jgi:hypothetical protein
MPTLRTLQTMDDVDAQLIGDFACLDPVYVDGIVGTLNLGETFATLYFRWTPRPGENGQVLFERTPAVYLVRPHASIVCTPDCRLKKWINGGRPPLLMDHRNLQ